MAEPGVLAQVYRWYRKGRKAVEDALLVSEQCRMVCGERFIP